MSSDTHTGFLPAQESTDAGAPALRQAGTLRGVRACLAPFLLLFLLGLLPGCIKPVGEDYERPHPYRIAVTIGMIADIVREIVGEHAQVENLIGEGLDPHLYQPNRADVLKLERAHLVIYHGLLLEGRMGEVLRRQSTRGKTVVALAEELAASERYPVARGTEGEDPHIWMDVRAWMEAVQFLAEALTAFDPAHATDYHARAETYLEQLEALDQRARQTLDTIPEEQRVLITAHDAFYYFGRAYDIEVRGIQGLSTSSEAGIRDIEHLVEFIVERRIPAIFVETSVSDKNVRALIEGARARGHEVRIGGTLFSDAMGASGTREGTYIGMMEHNITTIARALGGRVAEAHAGPPVAPASVVCELLSRPFPEHNLLLTRAATLRQAQRLWQAGMLRGVRALDETSRGLKGPGNGVQRDSDRHTPRSQKIPSPEVR